MASNNIIHQLKRLTFIYCRAVFKKYFGYTNKAYKRGLFVALLLPIFSIELFAQDSLNLNIEPYVKHSTRTGELNLAYTYQYSFKSSGLITKLSLNEGDTFTKGTLLASIDTDDLTAELKNARAEKIYINKEIKRLTKLVKIDAAAANELDKLKYRSTQLDAAIVRTREYLAATNIIAPYDGVVLNRLLDVNEWASAGQTLLEVAPLVNNWVVQVGAQHSELALLSKGTKMNLSDEQGNSVSGYVHSIASVPNPVTGLFNLEVMIDSSTEANQSALYIGALYQVALSQQQQWAFKVPSHLAKLDFNQTALVQIASDNTTNDKPISKRLPILGHDSAFVYLGASGLTRLNLIKP